MPVQGAPMLVAMCMPGRAVGDGDDLGWPGWQLPVKARQVVAVEIKVEFGASIRLARMVGGVGVLPLLGLHMLGQ